MGYYGQPSIFATIAKGIFIAVLAYGAFPTIFAICKPKINVKSYHWICFLVNFVVYLCFAFIGGNYNAAPYLLWTLAFCFIFKRFLPEIEPPIDYSKMEKKSFEEVSSSVPEEVLERCGTQRGSREGITRVAESFAKDGIIPLEYVPALVEEYMKPVNTVAKKQTKEEPVVEVEKESGVCYCRFCGAKIAEGDKFCCSCGAELNSATAPKRKHQKAGTERSIDYRPFIAIGVIVLLILVAVIVIIGMVGNSDEVIPTPEPATAEPVAPAFDEKSSTEETPIPTEEPKPRFISPERFAMENRLNWPISDSTGWSNYSDRFEVLNIACKTAFSWDDGLCSGDDDVYAYAKAYTEARVDGKSDLKAHEIGLEKVGLDKRILGKETYSKFIYNSAIAVGVSEYDAECFAEKESTVWDAAWKIYKYARETGKNHEKAIDSVMWGCFTSGNNVGFDSFYNRVSEYRNHVSGALSKAEEEQEELFRLLKEYYEGPGLDVDNISIGTEYSISVREKEPTSGFNTRDAGLNAYLNSLSDAKT